MSTFSKLTRGLKLAAVPLLLASLAACATPFRADVSRFQSQLPAPSGQSFAVVAEDPALAGGLEFSQYADFAETEMAALGYSQAASPENATLLVRFDYGVNDGRERVRSSGFGSSFGYRDPFYNSWYGYRPVFFRDRIGRSRLGYLPGRRWGYGFQSPFFGSSFDNRVESYTIYTSGVALKIDNAQTGERLFEGEAEAVSTSNRLQYLVPNLIEAMFTDFPGNSGETVRISVAPEDQPVQRGDRR